MKSTGFGSSFLTEITGFECRFDGLCVMAFHVVALSIGTGTDHRVELAINEVTGGTVVKGVTGHDATAGNQRLEGWAALDFAIIMGRATAGEKTHTGQHGELAGDGVG